MPDIVNVRTHHFEIQLTSHNLTTSIHHSTLIFDTCGENSQPITIMGARLALRQHNIVYLLTYSFICWMKYVHPFAVVFTHQTTFSFSLHSFFSFFFLSQFSSVATNVNEFYSTSFHMWKIRQDILTIQSSWSKLTELWRIHWMMPMLAKLNNLQPPADILNPASNKSPKWLRFVGIICKRI